MENDLHKYLKQQKNEITEYVIYQKLAKLSHDNNNAEILRQIAADEKKHYEFWKTVTGKEVKPDMRKVNKYIMLSKMFGLSYSLQLLEKGEKDAGKFYENAAKDISFGKKFFNMVTVSLSVAIISFFCHGNNYKVIF